MSAGHHIKKAREAKLNREPFTKRDRRNMNKLMKKLLKETQHGRKEEDRAAA